MLNADLDRAKKFCNDPIGFYDHSISKLQTATKADNDQLQLAGLQYRFDELRDSIPMLKKLADKQDITTLTHINDVIPLLFEHTMYKSYPPSLLMNNRFDHLTRWLDKLTAHDLNSFDASNCQSIDDWITRLNDETPMLICHTSGTSGTFSFVPRTRADWVGFIGQFPVTQFQNFGEEESIEHAPLNMHAIYPYYRYGGLSHIAALEGVVSIICGDEERLHAAYPGRLSSDVMLLAAKLRAAKARGNPGEVEISPELMARRNQLVAEQENMPQHITHFFNEMSEKLRGTRVYVQAATSQLVQMAQSGLEQGQRNLFAPNSVVSTGGGGKGVVLPDNWQDLVKEFLGVSHINISYGMTEMCAVFPLCDHNRYHLMPWVIGYVLEPETSEPLPRDGVATGRFAFYDLFPDSRWGGFITGDEVTIDWGTPCGCGRTTPHMDSNIQRFSDKSGEDDKISCAASPDAYAEAMDFLMDLNA